MMCWNTKEKSRYSNHLEKCKINYWKMCDRRSIFTAKEAAPKYKNIRRANHICCTSYSDQFLVNATHKIVRWDECLSLKYSSLVLIQRLWGPKSLDSKIFQNYMGSPVLGQKLIVAPKVFISDSSNRVNDIHCVNFVVIHRLKTFTIFTPQIPYHRVLTIYVFFNIKKKKIK